MKNETGGVTSSPCEMFIATVDDFNLALGTTLIMPGETQATTKRYKKLYQASIQNGHKVLVAKVSGTYIIIGRVYP